MLEEGFNAFSLLLGRQAKAVRQDLGQSDFRWTTNDYEQTPSAGSSVSVGHIHSIAAAQ